MGYIWSNLTGVQYDLCVNKCGSRPTIPNRSDYGGGFGFNAKYDEAMEAYNETNKAYQFCKLNCTSTPNIVYKQNTGSQRPDNTNQDYTLTVLDKETNGQIGDTTEDGTTPSIVGMSMNKKVFIGVGVLAVVGIAYYFLKVKKA